MNLINKEPKQQAVILENQFVYETPAIIYEGIITTRAGSGPAGDPAGSEKSGVDPADLFGNDD